MRVVDSSERLGPPALCFLCETSPQREFGVHVVDTERDFNPPALSHLSGNKYLCERCIDEAAHLLGFVRSDEIDTANNALNNARRSLAQFSEFAKSLSQDITEGLEEVLQVLPSQLSATPKSDKVQKKENK